MVSRERPARRPSVRPWKAPGESEYEGCAIFCTTTQSRRTDVLRPRPAAPATSPKSFEFDRMYASSFLRLTVADCATPTSSGIGLEPRGRSKRDVVRKERLELSRVSPLDSKSSASASSATFARVERARMGHDGQVSEHSHYRG